MKTRIENIAAVIAAAIWADGVYDPAAALRNAFLDNFSFKALNAAPKFVPPLTYVISS